MNADTPFVFSGMSRVGARLFARDRTATIAASVLLLIAVACFLAPLTSPYDPFAQPDILGLKNAAPSMSHPMGTDPLSRDVLSRVIYGGRLSLTVAVFATLVSVTLGTAYGSIAGFSEGFTASLLERILDAFLAIPRLLLLIAIFATWHDMPLGGFVIMLGVTGWYGLARLVRGQVLALKARDFVASARALGATRTRILVRHILPNVVTPVVVAATLGVGHVIVLEAGLSWLGIGIRQPEASWGNMIQDGSGEIATHWWISLFPGLAIVLTVMAFNVLGDALLRSLSPRQTVIE
ncbi:MAG: ABC transporter permease [Longimicrobiales bacterium]